MKSISHMTVEDAKLLLLRIKKEVYRRSGMDENGEPLLNETLRHFNRPILSAPDDSLFELKNTDDVIRALSGAAIIDKLINIADYNDLRMVHEYDPIPGSFDVNMLNALLDKLESESYDSPKSTCRSACTGLCINNCTSTCSGGCETSCSMCSSACMNGCETTCTGCAEECGTSCGVSCGASCSRLSAACADCSAGCYGCTGCSETCTDTCTGCNYTCSAACTGGLTSNAKIDTSIPIITLYHNANVYSLLNASSASNGTFVLPEYGYDNMNPYNLGEIVYDISSEDNVNQQYLTNGNNHPHFWIDDQNQLFKAGDKIYFAANDSQYNTNKSLSRLTTKSTKLKSIIMPQWAELTRYHIDSPIQTVVDIISDTFTIEESTVVHIAARIGNSEVTGFNPSEYGIYINDNYVNLPYNGILTANDTVRVIPNAKITYMLKRAIANGDVNAVIKMPTGKYEVDITAHCLQCNVIVDTENMTLTYNTISDSDCKADLQSVHTNVSVNTDSDGNASVNVVLSNNLYLGADNNYHGYMYSIDIDVYRPCTLVGTGHEKSQYYPYPYYGDTSKLFGMAAFASTEDQKYRPLSTEILTETTQTQERLGSKYRYKFTVPESNDIGAIAFGDDSNESPYVVRFLPGHTYSIYKNQSIVLRPIMR